MMKIDPNFGRRNIQSDSQNSPTEKGGKEKSVEDILAQAMEILQTKPSVVSYTEPLRKRLYWEVLYTKLPEEVIFNVYLDGDSEYPVPLAQNGISVLVHSHPVGEGCFAPTFCHVLGYLPVGDEHPAFIRNFYKKWPQLNVQSK